MAKKDCILGGDAVGNRSGLTTEAAYWISEVAKSHFYRGATTLEEVVERTKQTIPGVKDVHVWNSISGRSPSNIKRGLDEAQVALNDIKSQARMMAEIDDIMLRGIPPEVTISREPSAEVEALRRLLNDVRMIANRSVKKDNDLKAVNIKINEILDKIDQETVKKRVEGKKELRVDIDAAKKEYRLLKRLLNTQDNIKELERQIRENDPKPPKTREPVLFPELEKALSEKKQLKRKIDDLIRLKEFESHSKMRKAGEIMKEALLSSRTAMASADLSFILRQGLLLSITRPGKAFGVNDGAFVQGIKSIRSQQKAETLNRTLIESKHDPMAAIERNRAGLFMADLDAGINSKEELFMGNMFKDIPYLRKMFALPRAVTDASNRSFAVAMNYMRAAAFDSFVKNNPSATQEEKSAYAKYVNAASGRGTLGKFEGAAQGLATVFFAPRFMTSRFQAPGLLVTNLYKDVTTKERSGIVTKAIARDWAGLLIAGGVALALAKWAGAKLEGDPEDSDWGKIQIGKTRVDIWGGFQQPARLSLSVIISGAKSIGWMKGKSREAALDSVLRFGKYKAAPTITVTNALWSGYNVIGREQSRTETIIRAYMPLTFQEMIDQFKETEDWFDTAWTGVGSGVGLGLSVHTNK